MPEGYKSILSLPLWRPSPYGLAVGGIPPPSLIRPSLQWVGVLHRLPDDAQVDPSSCPTFRSNTRAPAWRGEPGSRARTRGNTGGRRLARRRRAGVRVSPLRCQVRPAAPVALRCDGGGHRDDRRAPRDAAWAAHSALLRERRFPQADLRPSRAPRASLPGASQYASRGRCPPHQGRLPGFRARVRPARARTALVGWHRCRRRRVVYRARRREAQQQGGLERFTVTQARVRKSQGAGVPHGCGSSVRSRARPFPRAAYLPAIHYRRRQRQLVFPRIRGQQGACDPQLHGTQDQDLPAG